MKAHFEKWFLLFKFFFAQNNFRIKNTVKIVIFNYKVNCLLFSSEHLDSVDRSGLLLPLLDLLNLDDVLVRLSAIDLLTSLAYTQHGLRYGIDIFFNVFDDIFLLFLLSVYFFFFIWELF